MISTQLKHLDNYIALINSRMVEQARLEQQANLRYNALIQFKGELEDLRARMIEAGEPLPAKN